jgi:hypothetical protein
VTSCTTSMSTFIAEDPSGRFPNDVGATVSG